MSIDLPLDKMSLADKLEVMEALWANISQPSAALPSPAWHRDVLEERRAAVQQGQVKFLDGDQAIVDLRNELGDCRHPS